MIQLKILEILVGTSGNDYIKGDANANELYGGVGDDTLDGGSGNDKLFGGSGNDTIISSGGNNIIDGGDHTTGIGDWVWYNQKLMALNINMNSTDINGYASANFGAESDKLINIENIKGTILADFIGGNNSNNILDAYMGDGNTLVGSGGDDTLLGSSNGNDIFKAGILLSDGTIVDGDDGNNLINGVGGTSNTVDYSAYASNRTIEVDLPVV